MGHLRSFRSCQGQQRSFEVIFGFFHDIFYRTTLYIFDHEEFNSKSIPEAALKISNPVLGSFFSLIASFFTAVSFIFQKQGNVQVNKITADSTSDKAAGSVFKQKVWWYGILSLVTAEILQLFAYKYAPTTLIAPLGAFRVIFTTVLSKFYLKEGITSNGKIGIFVSLVGALIITIHAPRQEQNNSAADVLGATNPIFDVYFVALVAYTSVVAARIRTLLKKGAQWHLPTKSKDESESHARTSEKTSALLATLQTCTLGAIGVLCTKLLTMLEFSSFSVFHVMVIAGIAITSPLQVYYVNVALKYDKASKITPVKYAGTNILIIVGSILLFDEWVVLDVVDTFGMLCGLLLAICGIRLVVTE